MWPRRKTTLYDANPAELEYVSLHVLHRGLIAKLLLVTEEIQRRDQGLIDVGQNLKAVGRQSKNLDQAERIMTESSEKMLALGLFLRDVLEQLYPAQRKL